MSEPLRLAFPIPSADLCTLNGKRIAARVGIATIRKSGQWTDTGKPPVSAGRTPVRAVLYMGTLAASRYHPVIRAFHQRMLADGKTRKVALAARSRKILVILDGMVKSGLHSIPDTVVS